MSLWNEPQHDKPTKWPVHQAKTQVSLDMQHNKTNKMTCAPSKDSDQPGHPPSLNRVFAGHIKKHYSQHEIFWHLSDTLKFSAEQYENLPDRKKSSASVYHSILFINWIECPKALNGGPFSPKAVSLMTVLKFHRQTEISCMTNWFVRQSGSFRIDCIEHIEKTLIRLDRCPGWSESLLGTHHFCWFCLMVAQI